MQYGLGLVFLTPEVSLLIFITTCECGTFCSFPDTSSLRHTLLCFCTFLPVSTNPPFLPIWMNVASLNPWLSDFHTAHFFDSSRCYLFWDLVVILSMVAWGGKACLSMPPYWPQVSLLSLLYLKSPVWIGMAGGGGGRGREWWEGKCKQLYLNNNKIIKKIK